MNDILGRELKDGDLCIGMAIGRNSRGMHIGVFQGSSVVYLNPCNEEYIHKSSTSNTYLIENPTEQELVIKEKVLKLLAKEEEERKRKAGMKIIPLSKLKVGGVYKDTQGCLYIYLGKRKVTLEDVNNKTENTKEGNCFVFIYSLEGKTKEDILDRILDVNTYRGSHSIDILKGNKKLAEMVGKFDIEFPLTKEHTGWHNKFKLTIE